MNTSSDPVWAAVQLIFVVGFLFWWAYAGGVALASVVLLRGPHFLRRTAIWSIALQLAPLGALVVLLCAALIELALNSELPSVLMNGFAGVSLLVGPAATLRLVFKMVSKRVSRHLPPSDVPEGG